MSWINTIFLTILDGNGTLGTQVADLIEWQAMYVEINVIFLTNLETAV